MAGHDIIVIGTSAGGLKALSRVVKELPADLDASVFVVQHFPPDRKSLLPEILSDVGTLPASYPRHGDPVKRSRIYVAPPDHHLLLSDGRMTVVRGPQENRFRPSIDALFRSAARAHGSRVVGVVLTGALDDGTIGLQAIKARGGITVVQDPREAEYPSMPSSALRYADPDFTLPLDEIPDFLIRMSREPAPGSPPVSRDLDIEVRIAEQDLQGKDLLESMDAIGTRTPFTCPACEGTLWAVGTQPLRFRCHTGHAFTKDALLAGQNEQLEHALWAAVRLMEEKANLYRHLAERGEKQGHFYNTIRYEQSAARLDDEALIIKQILLGGSAITPSDPERNESTESEAESIAPDTEVLR
jgi:two-component system chemotaxis response regulator CheB